MPSCSAGVCRIRPEESFLVAQSHAYAEVGIDVALAAINHGDVSPLQRHNAVVQ